MRVLLVEDRNEDARMAETVLRRNIPNIEIKHVPTMQSAEEAVVLFDPDVIFLDVSLPDLNRAGLRNAIAKLRGWAAVLVFTSNDESHFAQEVAAHGADEYLPKKYLYGDNRFFIIKLVRGYDCYIDRKPNAERNEIVAKELNEAMKVAQSRVSAVQSDSDEIGNEANLLIVSLSKTILSKCQKIEEGIAHTNGTVSDHTEQLNRHHQALEEIRLRHERNDRARAARDAEAARLKKEADEKAEKQRKKILIWLRWIGGSIVSLIISLIGAYLAHRWGWMR